MNRVLRALYWLAPIAFCIAIYLIGLRIWFEKDDFAWLNLRNHVTDFKSFWAIMFKPLAQGTIRPLSERAFFMLFSYFFGLRALPYRLFVFLNQFLNIILVMVVTRKLTKSQLAGFLAPLLWVACEALIIPMSWTSAYNEIQWCTFVLLGFYFFILYTETGDRKFYWAQWVTFVLGFGSLEINVVYPALVALYALFFARRYLKPTLPMFAASIVFAIVDRMAAPSTAGSFYYEMNFHPRSMLSALTHYWNILLGVPAYVHFKQLPGWEGHIAVDILTAAILGFAVWQAWKRRFLPLFCLCWFLIILAPLLPLHNHITEYYVMVPAIGVAILAAYGLSLAWTRGWAVSAAVAIIALLYIVPSTILAHNMMSASFDGVDRVRALIQSVAYAKKIHPGKAILLKDVNDQLFWSAIYDSPFHIFGWNDVFLTPDCLPLIHEDEHYAPLDLYFLPAAAVFRALNSGDALVYAVEGRRLRNVTHPYTVMMNSQPEPTLAGSIKLGVPYFKDQIGDGWYNREDAFRWSSGHAVVYMPGPAAEGEKLYLHGYTTEQQFQAGDLHLALTVDGIAEPVKTISRGVEFRVDYDLPPGLVGRPKIEVAFTVDRTTQVAGDERHLGLAFGEFTIR